MNSAIKTKLMKTRPKCKAITDHGTRCKSNAHKECGSIYCRKHRPEWIVEVNDEKALGVRRCGIHGCTGSGVKGLGVILAPDYERESCEDCRKRVAITDKKRRDSVIDRNKKLSDTDPKFKCCHECPLGTNMHPIEDMGVTFRGQISPRCKRHFERQQEYEGARIRPKRDYSEYLSREEVKQNKKQWLLDNPGNVYMYHAKYIRFKYGTNPALYKKIRADASALFRLKHPEVVEELKIKRKTNPYYAFQYYHYQADKRGIIFKLSIKEPDEFNNFYKLINSNCYYCNGKHDIYFNGIDRLDSSGGYTQDNTVPCCTMCNNMKNTLNVPTFILMCSHIVATNQLYPEAAFCEIVFNDYKTNGFSGYESSAESRHISFDINKDDFTKIQKRIKCYICGKPNVKGEHTNGIDRKNNDIGYLIDNCELCCGNCNYLKGKLCYDVFMEQCIKITKYNLDELDDLYGIWTPSKFHEKNTNKFAPDEINETMRLRKIKTFNKGILAMSEEELYQNAIKLQPNYGANRKKASIKPDQDSYNISIYDETGYDVYGYDQDGYDMLGYNAYGYDEDGFNIYGLDKTGYDQDGYDMLGYNAYGYDEDGFNIYGLDKTGYDQDGYDEYGYDKNGYNWDGYDKNGYNWDGYDWDGYDWIILE